MPGRAVMIASVRGYFAAVAMTDGPSLIHCMAGKDRTGVAVALLQTVLGVHRDDVVAEYLLTNTEGNFEARITAGIANMRRTYGPHFSDDAACGLVMVEPRYLNATFAAIGERPGGMQAYLRDDLGVDAVLRDALARRLVV